MNNSSYSAAQIDSLISRLSQRELPKAEWTHEAHLIVAIWFCTHYEEDICLKKVKALIIKHNESVGTPNNDRRGYHETITRCWLWIARQFLINHSFETITDACNAFVQSPYAASNYLLNFYSRARLFSVDARRNWVEPDKHPMTTFGTEKDV